VAKRSLVLLENRFFGIEQSTFQRWRLVTVLILQNEKDRFAELVARISLSSTGIFISKDQEQYNRSQAFKKISFFLLSASKDQLIPYLPAVQEKLVETFKQPYSIVFADAFLCIRLLIFKFSPRMLSSFWPTILTELVCFYRYFLLIHICRFEYLKNLEGGHFRLWTAQCKFSCRHRNCSIY
jgi:hypothetical protein